MKLSTSTTVARYQRLAKAHDTAAIAAFVHERFTERYLVPITTGTKHGFTMMAVACLMIEALESFRRGWEDTRNKSELAFCSFLSYWPAFGPLAPLSGDFYKHVRCGILHQAETTGGWRVLRTGPLFDSSTKTLNATRFVNALSATLDSYRDQLREADWQSDLWRCLQRKMAKVCKNALAPS